jgi:hypothetical protein
MGEKSSQRQVGREVPGRVFKGPVIDAYNRSTQPSIPTKFSQILTVPQTQEGFNTSSIRFTSRIPQTPGPGDYIEGNKENPSISKRSYHMTQSSRFKKNEYKTPVPGPGTYEKQVFKSSAAIIRGRGSDSKRTLEVPPPGYYNPKTSASTCGARHIFNSKAARLPSAPERAPEPWHYNPKPPKSSGSISRPFVIPSNFRREQVNLYEPHAKPASISNPGPGDYETLEGSSSRAKVSNMLLSSAVDRFGKPTRRRVSEKTPGPGEYSLQTDSKRSLVTGAVFLSESRRGWISTKGKPPGPAFYSPSAVSKRKSFHYKTLKTWV